jgi:hypothetical protein
MSNKYTVGRQLVGVLIVQAGQSINLPMNQGTSFEYTNMADIGERMGIDGRPSFKTFYRGYSGTIRATRLDTSLDDYAIFLQDAYYNSIVDQNGSITITVENSDLSLSTYIFTDLAFKVDRTGPFEGDKFVDIEMSFKAATFEKKS